MSSSSSSDSDSDDLEPIRKIKINIKPKEEVGKKDGADINVLKATIEAWRPLGPRPHQSMTRRQPSMSSVSSLSFGTSSGCPSSNSNIAGSNIPNVYNSSYARATNMRSSPSCSSLVNEFNNRSSFSNFMSDTSRTSSPLTLMSNLGDKVPIAIAIQESIEMLVKGSRGPSLSRTNKFDTRALGNIKVAFPNSFAQRCYAGYSVSSIPVLKLTMHSTENIIRYYASRLIKDLDPSANSGSNDVRNNTLTNNDSSKYSNKDFDLLGDDRHTDKFSDLFDLDESPKKGSCNSKIIEFDMEALVSKLKQLYEQSPNSRYYNVDVLRYQIAPIEEFDNCPLQVCAYWKSEQKLTKIRIDFKHSNKSGLNLERLRDIKFIVDLENFIPPGIDIDPLSPDSLSTVKLNNNNNNNNNGSNNHDNGKGPANNRATFDTTKRPFKGLESYPYETLQFNDEFANVNKQPIVASNLASLLMQPNILSNTDTKSSQLDNDRASKQSIKTGASAFQIRLPPPPSSGHHHHHSRAHNIPSSRSNLPQNDGLVSLMGDQEKPLMMQQNSLNSSEASNRTQSLFASNINSQSTKLNQMQQQPLVPLGDQSSSNMTNLFYNSSSLIDQETVSNNNRQVPPSNQQLSPDASVTPPYITYEPQAHWNNNTKQLTWKFDNFLSYYKSDGFGSLLAKLSLCNQDGLHLDTVVPNPVDVKFMVVDSTLSKISMSVDTTGYRMSLLKKEIRSGRYKSEPNIF